MTIHKKIQAELIQAMRDRDTLRLSVLRGIIAAFVNELIAKKNATGELPDDESVAVIKRLVKQRKDSIAQFKQGGRDDLVQNESRELSMLETYLPARMSIDNIRHIAEAKKAELGITDKSKVGRLTGAVMKELKNKADGADVKAVVDSLF